MKTAVGFTGACGLPGSGDTIAVTAGGRAVPGTGRRILTGVTGPVAAIARAARVEEPAAAAVAD